MPRGSQNVGAQNLSVADLLFDLRVGSTRGALRDSPFGTGIVLRLDCAEKSYHLAGSSERLLYEMLVREPLCANRGAAIG